MQPTQPDPAQTAQAILDSVQRDPREALDRADTLLADPAVRDPRARAIAEQAAGLALRELDDIADGLRRARRAVRIADAAGEQRVAAMARLSWALLLASAGRNGRAVRAIDEALPQLVGADTGRARMQRGVVLHYAGRRGEAERDYTAAIAVLRRHGDRLAEARALNNRGVVRAFSGDDAGAHQDLDRSGQIFEELDLPVAAADVRWNAAVLSAQQGDVPAALDALARVEREHQALGVPRPGVLLDRIDLLLSIPLVDEARDLAAVAVSMLEHRGWGSDAAEARLAQARGALAGGEPTESATHARAARQAFRRQGRRTWEAFARHVELRARVLAGQRSRAMATALLDSADGLDAMGWLTPAINARIDAAEILTELGEAGAGDVWDGVSGSTRGGTATQRALGWYARARSLGMRGDTRGALRALRRGLDELDTHRASLTATDLRASSGTHGQALATHGLGIAVQQRRPAMVLAWAERWRAGALLTRPARGDDDPELVGALTALRVATRELDEAVLAGDPTAALRRRQAELEHGIRDLTRARVATSAGTVGRAGVPLPTVRALTQALGTAALVEFVDLGGQLWAVVVAAGRATMHPLGQASDASRHLGRMGFSLRRLVSLTSTDRARAAARLAATRAAGELDDLLLGPLGKRIADRALVVVPTGELHAAAWSALPTCRGRTIAVAPSAAMWLRAATGPVGRSGQCVVAAGPGLPGAREEAERVAGILPRSRLLRDGEATTEAVLRAVDGASVAHIAAHATLRADNPLFSSLALADGPLTVYDLERLAVPPPIVVLSACDAGRPDVRPGDELMGLAAAFLGLGTRTLIGTVLPVPDGATTALVVDVHRRMRGGVPPAEALAEAQEHYAGQGDQEFATGAAFVCFGTGLA